MPQCRPRLRRSRESHRRHFRRGYDRAGGRRGGLGLCLLRRCIEDDISIDRSSSQSRDLKEKETLTALLSSN